MFMVGAFATFAGCNCPDGNNTPDASVDASVDGGQDAGFDAGVDAGSWPEGTQIEGMGDAGFTLDGGGAGGSTGTGVELTDGGALVLGSNDVNLHYAWIANNSNGWVSKYDTRTNKEVARYFSALPGNGVTVVAGNNPSRTSVDLNGDVWVANRATGLQGSVTKILGNPAACPDRNGNGVIDTSGDTNGDGVIQTGEFIAAATCNGGVNSCDECVVLTTALGGSGAGVKSRAMAIAQGVENEVGDIWVGNHAERRIYRLDPFSAQPKTFPGGLNYLEVPANAGGTANDGGTGITWGPYGMAVDSQQRLWIVAAPGDFSPRKTVLGVVNANTGAWIDAFIPAPVDWSTQSMYGIAIDGKDRVWMGAWEGGPYVYRYELPAGGAPGSGTWTRFYVGGLVSNKGTYVDRTRGIAADEDGTIWISSDRSKTDAGTTAAATQLIAINGDDGGVRRLAHGGTPYDFLDMTDADSFTAIGVGLDAEGDVWVNNNSGNVVVYDHQNAVTLTKQASGLYTYSDFTGYQLRHFTAPSGSYRYTQTGCGTQTRWMQVEWEESTPPGTDIELYVRPANALADYDSATPPPAYGPYNSPPAVIDGLVPQSQFLRLEFRLISLNREATPELRGFRTIFVCEGVIN